jgi:hypothetical protein
MSANDHCSHHCRFNAKITVKGSTCNIKVIIKYCIKELLKYNTVLYNNNITIINTTVQFNGHSFLSINPLN